MQHSELEPFAQSCGWVFPLLTLDVVKPFFALIGLTPVSSTGDFQRTLRDSIVALRKRVSPMSGDAAMLASSEFFQSIEAAIGPVATKRFAWWLRNILHTDPRCHIGLSNWDYVLRYCRHFDDRWERLGFPVNLSGQAREQFLKAIDVKPYKKIVADIQTHALSDWDLHMYASQLYDFDDDPQGPTINPFVTLLATVRDYQGYRFWAWILRNHRVDQLDRLWTCALQLVRDDELKSATDLPHPSKLDIGL